MLLDLLDILKLDIDLKKYDTLKKFYELKSHFR